MPLCSSRRSFNIFRLGQGDPLVEAKPRSPRSSRATATATPMRTSADATPVDARCFGSSVSSFITRAATRTKDSAAQAITAAGDFAVSATVRVAKFARVYSLDTGTSSGSSSSDTNSGSNGSSNNRGRRSTDPTSRSNPSKTWTERNRAAFEELIDGAWV